MSISDEYKSFIANYLLNNFIKFDDKQLFADNYSVVEKNYVYIIHGINDFSIDIKDYNYYVLFVDYAIYDLIVDRYFHMNAYDILNIRLSNI